MVKCPNCLATLPDKARPKVCPKCGKSIVPTSAKTVNLNDATIDGTVDLAMTPDPYSTEVDEASIVSETESSKTVNFNDATVDGTVDLAMTSDPYSTKVDEASIVSETESSKTVNFNDATVDGTLDLGEPQDTSTTQIDESANGSKFESQKTANFNNATVSGTIAFETNEASSKTRADETQDLSIESILGSAQDFSNISPLATITIGASGITLGGSSAPQTHSKGTTHNADIKRTAGGGQTARNSQLGSADTSIDTSRSAWSTISKRTLAEKAGPLSPLSSPPDYEIVNKLGEGGMGIVYSAIQKTLDRKVAIKAIKAGKANSDESRRKFFYEAQITSALDHPNIVPIHEMGSKDDGTLFYSMKMVDGTPWEDEILNKTRDENIEILLKVCDAVAFAHSRNIIHRDLKPENVMLGPFGEVLVMDWGLAVNRNINPTFGLSGTPVYMAPEMAKHDLSKIGKASDIYILGAILFQIIVGKAPHKGKSVRECMANAMLNINIDPGFEDPLLDIANHAMSTEPKDRYASIVEFKAAIREHLRHGLSIALTHRGEEFLQNAIRDRDFLGFPRALFSMQEALAMWPINQAAEVGLHRTRLAYGQCALDQGSYDLCLQTLDRRFEDEAVLHRLAAEKKAGLVQREKRFKLLKKVLAAVVLFTIISLTAATLYARRQTQIARRQTQIAQEQESLATQSAKSEELAKRKAQDERDKAEKSAEVEKAARISEAAAKEVAQEERKLAIAAKEQERQAKELEVVAREQAVASEQKAIESEKVAVRNARLALLGNYQSELNLALNQTNQFDIARSNLLLQQIKTIEKTVSVDNNEPILQNWAFRRIELLNNLDLPRVNVASKITAFQYAPASKRGIIGTLSGQVSIVDLGIGNTAIMPDRTLQFQDVIKAVAISPDGEDAIIATGSKFSEYSVYRWRTSSRDAVPIRSLGKRDLQRIAISPNGEWAMGGINAGLWKWERNAKGFETDPTKLNLRGSLVSLQFTDNNGTEIFGLSKLPNGNSFGVIANLKTNLVQNFLLPESIADQVSTAAISLDQKRIYLGLNDGSLLIASVEQASTKDVSVQQNLQPKAPATMTTLAITSEIQPKKHSTAVRGIEVHSDGTVLTFSDEPVVHVWRIDPNTGSLNYASHLVGLAGNVTNAKFLSGSENVAATDDLGNILQWNIPDQERRRMLSQSVPSKLLSQSLPLDGTLRSIDIQGVLRMTLPPPNNEPAALAAKKSVVESFIGHTPGATVTDLAIASSEPLIATVASLTAVPATELTSEVCVWNSVSRTMLYRSQYKTTGACRIAFVNRDKGLVISDGKESIMIPLSSPDTPTVEKRFGTRLVANHPTLPTVSALIATSGSVRLVDWQDPSKWDNEGYRYFDIAINNRYEPIEAAWAEDGKRLYILFEHGRIARLEWDGVLLTSLSWSDEMPVIRSVEQETPWRYFDFAVKAGNNNSDQLNIVVRSSESKSTGMPLQLKWSRAESRLRLPSEPSAAATPLPIETLRPNLHEVVRTARESVFHGALIAVDRQGTLTVTKQDKTSFSLGRPPCIKASHANDGKRWCTVHAGGMVLLATIGGPKITSWHQVDHPFAEVSQAELSADGLQLAIIGRLPSGASKVAVFKVSGPSVLTQAKSVELADAIFVRWHPTDNEFVMLNADKKWYRVDAEGIPHEIKSQAWDRLKHDPSSCFVSMEWLCEPKGKTSKPLWHMAVLSRTREASRLDFISQTTELNDNFQPIVSNSTITSFASAPHENVLAVGDENGTLGIWYVAPSFDQSARELFTLPGHRGAGVSQLAFSIDGSTILSSDTSQRTNQWRSR